MSSEVFFQVVKTNDTNQKRVVQIQLFFDVLYFLHVGRVREARVINIING